MAENSAYHYWRHVLKSPQKVVAPMVDQSELAWRLLCRRHGADLCYTPMLHACNIVNDRTHRHDNLTAISLHTDEDRPLIVQMCANDPSVLVAACRYAAPLCDGVDLNLGCPQMIAKRGHYGAFLQDEWPLVFQLVNSVHTQCSAPISAKIRVFESVEKTVEYAQMIEAAGAQLITVHGRTKEQKGPKTGVASWKHISAVKAAVKIPVIANGNIQYHADIERCLAETGVDAVMAAEGNLHNPYLFEDGKAAAVWIAASEYLDLVERHPCSMATARAHLFKLFHRSCLILPDIRNRLCRAQTVLDLRNVTERLRTELSDVYAEFLNGALATESDDKLPHFLCQPYVRPEPIDTTDSTVDGNETDIRRVLREQKRQAMNDLVDSTGLSRKRLKRMNRRPDRSRGGGGGGDGRTVSGGTSTRYVICDCGNPISLKCTVRCCRRCCRRRCVDELLDCPAHNFLIVSRNKEGPTTEPETSCV